MMNVMKATLRIRDNRVGFLSKRSNYFSRGSLICTYKTFCWIQGEKQRKACQKYFQCVACWLTTAVVRYEYISLDDKGLATHHDGLLTLHRGCVRAAVKLEGGPESTKPAHAPFRDDCPKIGSSVLIPSTPLEFAFLPSEIEMHTHTASQFICAA